MCLTKRNCFTFFVDAGELGVDPADLEAIISDTEPTPCVKKFKAPSIIKNSAQFLLVSKNRPNASNASVNGFEMYGFAVVSFGSFIFINDAGSVW